MQKYDASITGLDQDYAGVLSGTDPLTGEMANNVLAEAGIPSLVAGPDEITTESGEAMRISMRTFAVFMPRTAQAHVRDINHEVLGGELPATRARR